VSATDMSLTAAAWRLSVWVVRWVRGQEDLASRSGVTDLTQGLVRRLIALLPCAVPPKDGGAASCRWLHRMDNLAPL